MAGLADILGRVQGGGPAPQGGGPPMPQGGPPMPQGPQGLEGLPMPLPREMMIQLIMMILESLQADGEGGPQPGGPMPPQGGPPQGGGGGLPF